MPSPEYPIVTDRLLLRPIDPVGDVDAAHAYQSLPDVVRFIPYGVRTRDDVAEVLASSRVRSTFETPGHVITLAVVLRESGAMIGDVILAWLSEQHRHGEIGYVLHPDHHGRGYTTEAAAALLDYAFDGLDLHRVTARIDERNGASAAVLRKLGMRQEARLVDHEWFKGEWCTELHFAILADEWRARPQP